MNSQVITHRSSASFIVGVVDEFLDSLPTVTTGIGPVGVGSGFSLDNGQHSGDRKMRNMMEDVRKIHIIEREEQKDREIERMVDIEIDLVSKQKRER